MAYAPSYLSPLSRSPAPPSNPMIAMLTTSSIPTNHAPSPPIDGGWYMDSGATHHFTPEFGHLSDPYPYTSEEHAMVGNGKSIDIMHLGNVVISSPVNPIHLHHVLHTPVVSKQLISVTKLCANNHAFIELYPSHFLVKDQISKQTLLWGHLENGLYKLSSSSSPPVTSPPSSSPFLQTPS